MAGPGADVRKVGTAEEGEEEGGEAEVEEEEEEELGEA